MVEHKRKLCPICNKIKVDVYKGSCRTCRYKNIVNNSPLIKCECSDECQEMIHSLDIRGRPVIRKQGHQFKGNKHYKFKGIIKCNEYKRIKVDKNHPFKDKYNRISYHRYILEQRYSKIMNNPIYIDPKLYDIHHKDGNKDNNDEKNLIHLPHDYHARISNLGNNNGFEDMSQRICLLCGAQSDHKTKWHVYKNGWICNKCYNIIYKNEILYKRYAEEKVLCACGCGELIPKYNKIGQLAKYKKGHNTRKR